MVIVTMAVPEGTTLEDSGVYFLLVSLLALLMLGALAYSLAWRTGQRDYNLVKYGHIPSDSFRGLKAGLYSQIPGLVFGITVCVLYYLGVSTPYFWLKLLYFPFWWLFQLNDAPFMFVFAVVFVPFMAHWGYRFGYTFRSIRQKIMYQDPNKSEKKKAKDKRLR